MAYLRNGQYAEMVERGRLREELIAMYSRPRLTAKKKEWAQWCYRVNYIHNYSIEMLRWELANQKQIRA